ncbi:MAG: hypothetical protein R3F62_13495 [Planctomycetota bacterium]
MTQDAPDPVASEPEAPSRLQQAFADLRQAGAYGQAQWQRWIEAWRAEPAAEEAEAEATVPFAKRLLDAPAVLRAQRKGAHLLLSLTTAVRAQAEQLEQGLKRLTPASEADAVAQ